MSLLSLLPQGTLVVSKWQTRTLLLVETRTTNNVQIQQTTNNNQTDDTHHPNPLWIPVASLEVPVIVFMVSGRETSESHGKEPQIDRSIAENGRALIYYY